MNKKNLIASDQPAQMSLFQSFENGHNHKLCNLFPAFDLMPRGIYSLKQQAEMRDKDGYFGPKSKEFAIRNSETGQVDKLKITFNPANIEKGKDSGKYESCLIGNAEVLIEEVLKYMACNPKYAECDTSKGGFSVVVSFSFSDMQRELKEIGATMNVTEIRRSLEILSGAVIEVKGVASGRYDFKGALLSSVFLVSRSHYKEDSTRKNRVVLADVVGESLTTGAYRQANYSLLMGSDGRPNLLTNYLAKRLFLNYVNARNVPDRSGDERGLRYQISMSTLHNETGLLDYDINTARVTIIRTFKSLIKKGVLRDWEQANRLYKDGKICDYVFYLYPTQDFIRSQIFANRRLSKITKPGLKLIK